MIKDFLIVGGGIAGHSLAHQVFKMNQSFTIFDDARKNKSSRVAAGLYNPISLKRTNLVWKGHEFINHAIPFYQNLEKRSLIPFLHPLPIKRIYTNYEEVNNWEVKSAQDPYQRFLNPTPNEPLPKEIDAPFGTGVVKESGYVDMQSFFDASEKLLPKDTLKNEPFDYNLLKKTKDGWHYQDVTYRSVIFNEGVGVRNNPFFNEIPVQANKGDILTLEGDVSGDEWSHIFSKTLFLIPLGNHKFRAGATYQTQFENPLPDPEKRAYIVSKIEAFFKSKFSVAQHDWGLRPVTPDRRPILGRHFKEKDLYLFNGLGSRGVMMAPLLAASLLDLIHENIKLPKEIDIQRFNK